MFNVSINLQNDAFLGANRQEELARIMRRIAEQVQTGMTESVITDKNGNSVGMWRITK